MKNVFIGVFALAAFAAATSFAQPNNAQSVDLVVPSVLRVSISPATLTLDLSTVIPTPGTDLIGTVTDGSSTYRYVHNSGTGAAITVGTGSALPAGLELLVDLAAPPAGGTSTTVNLTSGVAFDAVSAIPRGAGSATATYTFRAYASGADPGTTNRTLTYTMHN